MNEYNNTLKMIKSYNPSTDLEIEEKKLILDYLNKFGKDAFYRESLTAHVTVSAIILNKSYDKILLAHHNIFNSYAWLGGHADGVYDLEYVIRKEIKEESGLEKIEMVSNSFISIEVLDVMPHIKKEKTIPCHLHLNFTYGFIADENDDIRIKIDENSSIKWIILDDLEKVVEEKKMIHIYKKIINKIYQNKKITRI